MKKALIGIVSIGIIVAGVLSMQHHSPIKIGGDRDTHGCLVAAGYAFDPQVGACAKSFEMTPDIKTAAALAVAHAGSSYALTVASFNSYEEKGSYDIVLEHGENRTPETVYIRGGRVVEPKKVMLYFYSEARDRDQDGNILCSEKGLVPVERTIAPDDQSPIETTIRLLLAGKLTDAERAQGISTEFPLPGLTLEKADRAQGVLTLTFNDPNHRTSGGSCRAGILWAQIQATAKQFAGVSTVRYLPHDLFQP